MKWRLLGGTLPSSPLPSGVMLRISCQNGKEASICATLFIASHVYIPWRIDVWTAWRDPICLPLPSQVRNDCQSTEKSSNLFDILIVSLHMFVKWRMWSVSWPCLPFTPVSVEFSDIWKKLRLLNILITWHFISVFLSKVSRSNCDMTLLFLPFLHSVVLNVYIWKEGLKLLDIKSISL